MHHHHGYWYEEVKMDSPLFKHIIYKSRYADINIFLHYCSVNPPRPVRSDFVRKKPVYKKSVL